MKGCEKEMLLIDPMIYFDKDENEVWKPLVMENIRSGEYLISNFGNIYDLINQKYISPRINKNNGYVYIHLRTTSPSINGSLLLHRVMAENFVGEKHYGQDQVNHKNGIKDYNKDTNLEWCTPKENTQHAFNTGLANNNIGERSHLAKLTDSEVERICELLSEGKRYREILDIIGIENTDNNRDMIGNIYRRIAWTRISDKYSFPEYDDRFRANSKDTIHAICKALEDGLSNREVYEKVFNKPLDHKDKQTYELIRLIRHRKQFKDISESYTF